jgi:uncharacterized OsmC-like protein
VVTVVGVAHRGQIPLQDIGIDFQVEPVDGTDARGFGVRKTVTLYGTLSATEQRRLQRAAEYCPVGQLFTKGALVVEDQVAYGTERLAPEAVAPGAQGLQPPTLLTGAPGAVHGRYLVETKAYDDSGVLLHEGEVKIYLTCTNRTRPGRWTLLAGHSSEGWVPPPVPLAYAALAASTVTTLRACLAPDAWPAAGWHVEIAPYGAGNREQAQASAAAGTLNTRRVVRTIVLHSTPNTGLGQAIAAALQQDPLTASFRQGGVVLDEQVVVTERPRAEGNVMPS